MLQQVNRDVLDGLTCDSILTVCELNKVVATGTYGAVILDHNVLQSLDQATGNIASLRSLHCSVDEAFSATHCMEVKLSWTEARQVAAFNETFRLWTEVIL